MCRWLWSGALDIQTNHSNAQGTELSRSESIIYILKSPFNLVFINKGKIGFSSAGSGQGSTFFFELPLYSTASAGVDQERNMLAFTSMPVLERRASPSPVQVRGSEETAAVLEQDCVLSDFDHSSEEDAQAAMRHSVKSEPLLRHCGRSSPSLIRISRSVSEMAQSPSTGGCRVD